MTPGGSPRPRSILEAGIASRRRGRFLAVGAAGFRGSFSQEVFGAARESVPATLGMTPEGSRASPPPPDPGISLRRRERVSDVVAARDARPRAGPQHSPKRVRPASWGKHRGVRRAARRLRRTPGTRRSRRSRPGAIFRPPRAAMKPASVGPKTRWRPRSKACLRGPTARALRARAWGAGTLRADLMWTYPSRLTRVGEVVLSRKRWPPWRHPRTCCSHRLRTTRHGATT